MNPIYRRLALVVTPLALTLGCGSNGATGVNSKTVASVSVSPALDTLVALQDTMRLTATARDAAGTTVPGVAVTWSSSDPTIASVDNGLVTAVANGATTIKATVTGVEGTAALVVQQRPAAIATTQGDDQGETVGAPLDSVVVVEVQDARGYPVAGIALSFTPDSGAGSADPAQGVADSSGQLTTHWTLGVHSGIQILHTVVSGDTAIAGATTATAFADLPDSMYLFAGNNQFELASLPLPHPIQVKVIDQYGNPVPDAPITFSAAGGTLDSTDVSTDLDGVASATWTLGASLGPETAQAILPDSAVADVINLKGSPVSFSASAVAYALDSVSPNPPVVGQSMTLYGMGFAPDPQANSVTAGGVVATVTSGTQTTLTVDVPSFGCTPAQTRDIAVTRNATQLSLSTTVQPAGALQLAVGGTAVLTPASDLCLQFLSSGSAGDYIVGLTSTRPLAGDATFAMTGDDGVNPPPSPTLATMAAAPTSVVASPLRREWALRDWESSFFATHRGVTLATAGPMTGFAAASAAAGTIGLHVPDITTDPCNNYASVTAAVLAQGPKVVVATDATLPTDLASQAIITTALDSLVTRWGNVIYKVATQHFGLPAQVGADSSITLLFSPTVATMGVKTFTTAVDLLDPSVCPASNGREVIYVAVPAAPTATDLSTLLASAPPDLAHDLGLVIALSRRLAVGGIPLATWLEEAGAQIGTEVVGLAATGDASQMDYGATVVNGSTSGLLWYRPLFDRLAYLFGWDGASGTVTGAPENCSLFGYGGLAVPCGPQYAAGAAWSFLRYVSDRTASTFSGGEAAFQTALIGADPTHDGVAVLDSLTGEDLSQMMVEWAMTLYTDGRVGAAAAPTLQLSSWNLANVFGALPAAQQLSPPAFGFASFARSGTVIGGGTAYTRITAGGAHGPLALQVRDGSGNPLGDDLKPRLWVVRVQ
jgi:hypothetical protein